LESISLIARANRLGYVPNDSRLDAVILVAQDVADPSDLHPRYGGML
jgi:hypothetical protein